MLLQIHHIHPGLQPFVKLICSMEFHEESDKRHIRVLPDSCVEIFFNYTSSPLAIIDSVLHKQSIVNFRMNEPKDVQMRKGSGSMAVCFHPGRAYPFFRRSMDTFRNVSVALADVWGRSSGEIDDRLSQSISNSRRAEIVQDYLLRILHSDERDRQLEYCLNKIHGSYVSVGLSRLSNDMGISQRHLSRIFRERVGLSPKEYLRMNRFLRSLSYLKSNSNCSLTEVAYRSGYYDQAHFIHDYRSFAGHSPGEVATARHIVY